MLNIRHTLDLLIHHFVYYHFSHFALRLLLLHSLAEYDHSCIKTQIFWGYSCYVLALQCLLNFKIFWVLVEFFSCSWLGKLVQSHFDRRYKVRIRIRIRKLLLSLYIIEWCHKVCHHTVKVMCTLQVLYLITTVDHHKSRLRPCLGWKQHFISADHWEVHHYFIHSLNSLKTYCTVEFTDALFLKQNTCILFSVA